VSGDQRIVLESIVYGGDPDLRPGDRLRALELLAELDAEEQRSTVIDRLSPEETLAELESLAAAVPAMLATARGPGYVVPPDDPGELMGVIELQELLIAALEARVLALEGQLQRERTQRLLGPAPPVIA
jgi:hypothetical protein